ncbi:MAG: DUF4973 domain-containing protein [Prevotella sp.]|nr:DUF4973 domain-containing protein [Prevotella sp.]
MLSTSCNDEWEDEQYTQYISFKAPLGSLGVTDVYVPYSRHADDGSLLYGQEGLSSYQLPVIVSGSKQNDHNITVHIGLDPDTLQTLNYARFSGRNDLYYVDMKDYASFPETVNINAGEDIGLLDIRFNFADIDMSEKWILPLQVLDNTSYGYTSHPIKNYAKAMLRVFPYNDFSGNYSATTLLMARAESPSDAIGGEESRAYVVDENTVFFYAGIRIDEERTDRKNYKVYAHFEPEGDGSRGTVELYTDNPAMKFATTSEATYMVYDRYDEVRPYLLHHYIIISDIGYNFTDYTSAVNHEFNYIVSGTMTLERQINTQIPNEDQAIEW